MYGRSMEMNRLTEINRSYEVASKLLKGPRDVTL